MLIAAAAAVASVAPLSPAAASPNRSASLSASRSASSASAALCLRDVQGCPEEALTVLVEEERLWCWLCGAVAGGGMVVAEDKRALLAVGWALPAAGAAAMACLCAS
jgi:hypothetical protein